MRHLRAFFLLAGRPAMGCATLLIGLVVVMGVTVLAPPGQAFLLAFALPAMAGMLAGQLVQELQHGSFAWPLPGVRWKTALGFLLTGAAVTLLTLGLSWLRGDTSPLVFFAVGLSAYGLGSLLFDPLSPWVSAVTSGVGLSILIFSAGWAELAVSHPLITIALVAPAMVGVSLWRTFGRTTFRRKPFHPTLGVVSAFDPEIIKRYEREKLMAAKPGRRSWRAGYLGTGSREWIRASWYETWGDGQRAARMFTRAWPVLLLIVAAHAWRDEGGETYLVAFAKTFYHAFFRPPDEPSFGEHPDPHLLVTLTVSFFGALLAFEVPAAVASDRGYPLSRRDRCRIVFWGQLANLALYALAVGLGLFLIVQTVGWVVGYGLRLDSLPYYLRSLLATLVLMPMISFERLRARSFESREPGKRAIAFHSGTLMVISVVGLWSFMVTVVSPPVVVELGVMAALLAQSLRFHRRRLEEHFATADLV